MIDFFFRLQVKKFRRINEFHFDYDCSVDYKEKLLEEHYKLQVEWNSITNYSSPISFAEKRP